MEFGVHLPLIGWPGRRIDAGLVPLVAEHAEQLGFRFLSANDHLVYRRPWLDGPTALTVAAARTSTIGLMTSVALPVIRGPLALAKSLAALDLLSQGRVIAGLGPGSSAIDYAAVGIPFAERWARFDESIGLIRSAWSAGAVQRGRFYGAEEAAVGPRPRQPGGPPIWIGSWGSDAGLRRVARLADGWLASAYNTDPQLYARTRQRLDEFAVDLGREQRLPTALGSAWLAITSDRAAARQVIERRVAPVLGRSADEIAERVLIGPESQIADRLAGYAEGGLERVFVWPVEDEISQLERFAERVMPELA